MTLTPGVTEAKGTDGKAMKILTSTLGILQRLCCLHELQQKPQCHPGDANVPVMPHKFLRLRDANLADKVRPALRLPENVESRGHAPEDPSLHRYLLRQHALLSNLLTCRGTVTNGKINTSARHLCHDLRRTHQNAQGCCVRSKHTAASVRC